MFVNFSIGLPIVVDLFNDDLICRYLVIPISPSSNALNFEVNGLIQDPLSKFSVSTLFEICRYEISALAWPVPFADPINNFSGLFPFILVKLSDAVFTPSMNIVLFPVMLSQVNLNLMWFPVRLWNAVRIVLL